MFVKNFSQTDLLTKKDFQIYIMLVRLYSLWKLRMSCHKIVLKINNQKARRKFKKKLKVATKSVKLKNLKCVYLKIK